MKTVKNYSVMFLFIASPIFLSVIAGCSKNDAIGPEITDDEFIQEVMSGGYDNDLANEDNLISRENEDMNDEGAVFDDENSPPLNNYDSVYKSGRIILSVNKNINITTEGDTIKNAVMTKTVSGNFIVIGYMNGTTDTTIKPFTEVIQRKSVFKRVASTNHPRKNWRLYQISGLDGETTIPETGSSKVQITKIEIYKNNSAVPAYTFSGPDFTLLSFTTKLFGGTGIPVLDRNDLIKVKVYTVSQMSDTDKVAFHWSKNNSGKRRVTLTMESQTGNGPYNRIYSKDFTIFGSHKIGVFNAYLRAATRESLYDIDPGKYASDAAAIPFRITR